MLELRECKIGEIYRREDCGAGQDSGQVENVFVVVLAIGVAFLRLTLLSAFFLSGCFFLLLVVLLQLPW